MKLKYLLGGAIMVPLLPLMYLHGKRIINSVPKLPDAEGPEGVVAGNGQRPLRLLVVGESTMSGVGVATHEKGFSGALARTLGAGWGTEVQWKVYARSGYTLKRVRHELLPLITENEADLIVVGMGGNEAFKLNTPAGFRRDMQAVIDELRTKFGPYVPIAFPNMPPIKEFPAFTSLMKFTLGNMVEFFGQELEALLKDQPNTYYNPEVIRLDYWTKELNMDNDPTAFFSDGVHPSGLTYTTWGKDFGGFLVRQLGEEWWT
ncbi:SGNH/GDSL hydrolase family protein [Neolewinella persica]|uniref:SGNH/GDSL hydrolase family protein n=1 Tax=Neolewinella persica TaxID=70998 RepID=UPI000376F98E|nr:SGNH/GDSL hydrolase family protein [Neolewinella persica]